MATELPKYTVEVYDNKTGEHYERPATTEELAYYAEHDTIETDETITRELSAEEIAALPEAHNDAR